MLLGHDFEGKMKLKEWITRLVKMEASNELTEQHVRQLHFDLESSYNSFMRHCLQLGLNLSVVCLRSYVVAEMND